MSRLRRFARSILSGFPRVSGDEPSLINHEVVQGEFSPRERG